MAMLNKNAILEHLVWMASYDKHYAWWAAKQYAGMLPEWQDLPELLTAEMKAKNERREQSPIAG
jgi:hypothetical protein